MVFSCSSPVQDLPISALYTVRYTRPISGTIRHRGLIFLQVDGTRSMWLARAPRNCCQSLVPTDWRSWAGTRRLKPRPVHSFLVIL